MIVSIMFQKKQKDGSTSELTGKGFRKTGRRLRDLYREQFSEREQKKRRRNGT